MRRGRAICYEAAMKDPGPVTADRTAPAECAAFLLATPAGLLDPARAVCVVRLAAAAGCGESRREEWFTAAEQAEIERAGRPRRRQEKRAGKLAAKLAVRDWLARRGGDLPGLGEIEILADAGAPTLIRQNEKSAALYVLMPMRV